MLQFYYLHICYTIFTLNEYYYASLSKSIHLMKVVNTLKYFCIKSLLEVGPVCRSVVVPSVVRPSSINQCILLVIYTMSNNAEYEH
jgi:hypothetical protein